MHEMKNIRSTVQSISQGEVKWHFVKWHLSFLCGLVGHSAFLLKSFIGFRVCHLLCDDLFLTSAARITGKLYFVPGYSSVLLKVLLR